MCGRLTQYHDIDELVEHFQIHQLDLDLQPLFNVAPTQTVPAIIQDDDSRVLTGMRWGLVPFWAKDTKIGNQLINARAETVADKPAFKNALKRRRCIIPASGFFEWKRDGKVKQPFHIHFADGKPLGFAGLWETWKPKDADKEPLHTFTIITTAADKHMQELHDRMPVIVQPQYRDAWLEPGEADVPELLHILSTAKSDGLIFDPVSTLVNSPKNQSADCIKSISDPMTPDEAV